MGFGSLQRVFPLVLLVTLTAVTRCTYIVNVTAPVGQLGGVRETLTLPDFRSVTVTSFWGIPYAEPPLGPLRFRKPVAKQRIPGGYLVADTEGVACAQDPAILKSWIPGPSEMSEDCLKLNVYVPNTPLPFSVTKQPVMVWFYGGAFLMGQTRIYDGRRLAAVGQVVVVTVSYRLGPLGFLSTDDGVSPGNLGLWDQHVALKWVHRNIAAFGGNPDHVTVFGESAGGASSIYHLLYPGSQGLVHRVIAESGTALCPWAFQPLPGRVMAERLARRLGCEVTGFGRDRSRSLVDCLRAKPFLDIVTNSSVGTLEETLFRAEWVPTQDGEFIRAAPRDVLSWPPAPAGSGGLDLFRGVDLLVGTNDYDGEIITRITVQMFLKERTGMTFQDNNLTGAFVTQHYFPQMTQDGYDVSCPVTTRALELVYKDDEQVTERRRALQTIVESTSDFEFIMPTLVTAGNHAAGPSQAEEKSTYVYSFGHHFPYVARPDWLEGAAHGDDLPFVFGLPDSMTEAFNLTYARAASQWRFAEVLMTYWSNFAKTGNPNFPIPVAVHWPEYSLESPHILTLTPGMTFSTSVTSNSLPEREKLWKEVLPQLAARAKEQCNEDHVMVSGGQPEVKLNNSRLLGLLSMHEGRKVSTFLGIPFAEPPTGQLRFTKTVPLTSLPAVINATEHKPACFSLFPSGGQSEDCLYLNVWVPADAGRPLAVMVWVHGGGFITGSSASNQGALLAAENDVIVVSMNYRLGPFGFLSTEDAASRGNYGLWDQQVALQWVRHNIAAFGGHPDNITLFGLSAGGKSVSFHMVSPHSRGLFQRAIVQSGTVYCPTALQWTPRLTATRLAHSVGCHTASTHAMLRCLRLKPAHEIASAADKLWDEDAIRKLIDFGWSPVQDGDFVPSLYAGDGTLLPLAPTFTGSVMLGVNNNEGALIKTWRIPVAAKLDPDIETKLGDPEFFKNRFLPEVMAQMFKSLPEDLPSFDTAAEVVAFVHSDRDNTSRGVSRPSLYNAFGELAYIAPSFRFLRQWLNAGSESSAGSDRGKVFAYVFDNYPDVPVDEPGLAGMKHGDDAAYTFASLETKLLRLGASEDVIAKERELGKSFRKLLTNFAKSGDPATPQTLSGWPKWPVYDLQQQAYLSISSTPRVAARYLAKHVALCNDLVPALVTTHTGNGTSSQQGHARKCPEQTNSESSGGSEFSTERLVLICLYLIVKVTGQLI